jgi:Asp-tRNA(Asn)/Glu-tRNA(Gln) amidotransferase A subunit family amidase
MCGRNIGGAPATITNGVQVSENNPGSGNCQLSINRYDSSDWQLSKLYVWNRHLSNTEFAEAAASFEDLTLSNLDDTLTWQDAAAWPNAMRKARFLSAVDHVQLDRLRYLAMQALEEMFTQVDVLIGPFMTGPMLIASNFTGHPCLHLRAGFEDLGTRSPASLASGALTTGEADTAGQVYTVPQGISLWGRLFDEGPILTLGLALERALAVADRRPDFGA